MQLLTVKELSKLIKVKSATLYAWASKGLVPCYKLNGLLRFKLEEVEEWVTGTKMISQKLPILGRRKQPQHIGNIVQKAVEHITRKKYNRNSGKPDRNQGLGKEV